MNFYSELKKLALSRPSPAVHARTTENADFSDYVVRSKNMYLSFFAADSQDCFYSEYLTRARDCVDCMRVTDSELCYECVDSSGMYNGSFLQDCHNGSDLEYCFDCVNCKDCFGSFGLRQQRFCIFNKVYPEAVYREKITGLRKNLPQKILEILRPEFERHPRLYARQLKGGEHCVGDYIYFSKNCYGCFVVSNLQDSAYCSDISDPNIPSADNVDCDYASGIQGCYECFFTHSCSNSSFLCASSNCADSEYLMNCMNCQHCFGCVYLSNKEYCILNRQFTKEEYELALLKIKGELKESGQYGKSLVEILKN